MRRAIAIGAIVLTGLAGFAGCGDDDESQATAEENLCASLTSFSAAVVNLQGLDPTTASKDDYEEAAKQVEDAGNAVREDAKDVAEADSAALESAAEDLKGAVEDAPTDVPVAEAVAGLQPQVEAAAQAWREMYDGLGCRAPVSSSASGQ